LEYAYDLKKTILLIMQKLLELERAKVVYVLEHGVVYRST